jgi:hypothetical protein
MGTGVPDLRLPAVTVSTDSGTITHTAQPANTLPGWPGTGGSTSDPKKTFVITHYGAAPKTPPTIGPNSDPAIPTALAEINYKPLPVSQLDAPIAPGYGRYAIGGNRVRHKKWGSDLMVLSVWGDGGLTGFDAIEKVYAGDVDITITTVYQHYLGLPNQTANSAVLALFGQADALPSVCYTVLQVTPGLSLDIWAIVRGRKVYDPRTALTAYSNNAALCLADYITYFTDYTVDWDSVEVAADYCDEWADAPANTIRRWQVNMPLATPKPPDEWMAILAEYANCYLFRDDGVITLLPDKVRAVDHVMTVSDVRAGSLNLRKSGQRDTPTQVVADYTLPTATGVWGTDVAQTADPAEDVPLRVTPLHLLGYQQALQAKRKAVQFLNYANVSDLFIDFETFDNGVKIVRGDVISMTHPVGLAAKEFRVLDCQPIPGLKGRWKISGREYSPLLYSDEVVANPNVPDTDLPRVDDEPTPANLVAVEELYNISPGETRSRLVATADAVSYPFQFVYDWQVLQDSTVLHSVVTGSTTLVWGPLPIDGGVTFTVRVRVRGPVGVGAWATTTINILGKLALPLPPTVFRVFEAQGTVFFQWTPGLDVDLRGYEIRYGPEDQAWEFMELVNRWGIAAAGETSLVPPGTWDFEIRSFDSVRTVTNPVGQYSATGLRQTCLVDADANSFHIADYPLTFDASAAQFSDSSSVEFSNGSPVEFADGSSDSVNVRLVKSTWWTDSGESWLDVFGTDPLTGLDQPIISYLSDTASTLASSAIDFGQVLSLTLSVTSAAEAVVGTVDTFIETKVLEGDAWTRHSLLTVKATAQYARVVYETDSSSRLKCGPDTYGILHADVVANEKRGDVETDGIGPTTVDLGVEVTKFRFIGVTAIGLGIRTALEDVTVGDPGTFDVYFLDEVTLAHVAAEGYWLAQYY